MKRKRQMRKLLALLLAMALIMQNGFCIMAESLGMEPDPVFESNDFSDSGDVLPDDMEPIDAEVIQPEQSADQTDGLLPEISEQPVSPSEENDSNADFGDGSGSEPTDIPTEDIFGDTPATPEEMDKILQSQKAEILASAEQTLILDGEDTRIRYLLKVKNSDAEITAVTDIKVMLPETVSYMAADDETKDGLLVFENAAQFPEGINLNEAGEELRAAYANGNVVMWLSQSLAPGEERTYSFAGKPCDTTMRDALGAAWLVDGRALGYDCVTWTEDINPEENAETPADEEILAGDGDQKDEEVLIQKEEDEELANVRKMGTFRMMFAADSLDDGEPSDTSIEYDIATWNGTESTLELEVEQQGTDNDGKPIIETVWKDFSELNEEDVLPEYSSFRYTLKYQTPVGVSLNPGDKLTYQLPDWMGTVSATGSIMSGQNTVGSWAVDENNKLVISLYDDYLKDNSTGLEGTIELTGTVETIKTSEDIFENVTIQIGDAEKTFEIKERDNGVANIDLKKELKGITYRDNVPNNNIEKVSYSISVIAGKYTGEEYSKNNKDLKNVVIKDTFTLKEKYGRNDDAKIVQNNELKKYLHYKNIKCYDKDGNLVDVPKENIEIVPNGASFNIKVGNLAPEQEYTITYDVEIDPEMYTSNPRGVAADEPTHSNGGGTQTDRSDLCMSEMSWIYRTAENTAGVMTATITPQDESHYAETAKTEDHLIFNKVWNYKGASEPKAGWRTTYYLSVNEAPVWDIRGWHLLEDLKVNNQKIVSDIRVIQGTDWNDSGAIVVPLDVIQNGTADQKKAYGFATLSEDGFDFVASEAVNYRFVFDAEYYGPKTEEDGMTMRNRTNLTPGVNSGEQDYGAYKEPAFRAGTMTKRWTGTDMVNGTISWQTTIDKGIDVKAGDVYYDFFGWKRGDKHSDKRITDASQNDHIMPERLEDLELEIVSGPNETPVTDGYELEYLEPEDLIFEDKNDGFKIVFTGDVEGPVLIRYKSKADFTKLGKDQTNVEYNSLEEEYINQALLEREGNQSWYYQAIYRYKPSGIINKTAANFSNENPYITWTISVNGQHDDTAAAIIKDRIPDGLDFNPEENLFDDTNDLRLIIAWEENKVTGEGAGGQKLDDYREHPEDYFSFAYDPETRFLTIELKKLSYTEVKFELKTRPTADSLIEKKDYTNTAGLYIGDVQVGSSSAVASADYTFADKNCSYDGTTAPNATFTVDVNPAGIMLADEPDKMITVSDDFSQTKMILLPETFKVINSYGEILGAGEDYEITFDPKMKGFTLLVPDQTKLKVEYQVYVPGKVGTNANVSNSVKLSYDGKELKTVDYTDTKTVMKGSATVDTIPQITIIKFEEGDYNKKLEGAEFTVAPYIKDEETGEYKAGPTIGTITTNEDGEANTYTGGITLEAKKYYCFWESKAPEGYVLDSTVHPFVILGQADDTANIPEEIQQVYSGFKFSVQDMISTEVKVEKIWNDGNNKGNTRPESVTIKLLKDDQETDKTLILNEENGWKGTFGNLEKFENGSEIEYSVAEVPVDNYQEEIKKSKTPDENGTFTYTVKNTVKTEISGEKKWNDGNSPSRPASITVHIMNGDTIAKSVTLSAGEDGIWDIDDLKFSEELPMYDSDGNEIRYTIKEDAVDGYFTAIQGTDITNTEAITVSGTKNWNDTDEAQRPQAITVLIKNGNTEVKRITVTPNDNGEWKYSETLPKYDSNGTLINYTVEEVPVDGYQTSVEGYSITNTEVTEISGQKKWEDSDNADDIRPVSTDKVGLTLYKQVVASKKEIVQNAVPVWDKDLTGAVWTFQYTGLPAAENGQKVIYSVDETTVPDGYTKNVTVEKDGTVVITNTHIPEVTSLSGTKTWEDNNDQDGLRPGSIELTLYKLDENGKEAAVEASPVWNYNKTDKVWHYTYSNLQKNQGGKPITYFVKEEKIPDGYNVSYDDAKQNITNTHTPEKTEITVSKSWEDNDNQDGKRPTEITINLLANDKKKDSRKVTSKEGWTCTFEKLDKYEGGKEIEYTIEEEEVKGYTAEIEGSAEEGFIVTNTHTPEKTKVAVSKNWEDNNNQDGKRPTSITINLLANDKKKDSKKVTSKDSWICTFEDLDKYKDGKEIKYTIEEEKVEGYTTEIEGSAAKGFVVTNTHTPEKTEITVSKSWEDNDNQDGKRPTEITINLLANDKKKDSRKVTSKEGWTCTFEDLDKYKDGKEIKYTIEEEKVEGYTTEIEGSAAKGFVVTNTHTPEKTEITVSKSWEDNDNQDGKRPTEITINLLANDKKKDSKEVTSKEDWTCTFEDLDKYEDGKEIKYTIEEEKVEGYTTEIEGSAAKGFVVTNTYTPEKTEITVSKSWEDNDNQDGKRPTEITINLLANDKKKDSRKVTSKEGWTCTFEDLDKYKDGKEIKYTIEEEKVEGYTTEIEGSAAKGFVVTNTHTPEKTKVAVSKNWEDNNNQDGKRPTEITINLLANGKKKDSRKVTSKADWTCTFENLDKYEGGKEIEYTIKEEEVEGYTAEIEGSAEEGFVVTNTHTPEKTEITVSKSWKDNDNQDGKRPTRITINLLANGEKKDSKEVTSKDSWTCTFEDLDKYEDGKEIKYTIGEEEVEGYTAEIEGSAEEGFIVTNTHTPEKTKVAVSKNWEDKNNQDGKRPTRITINLLANDKKKDSKEVTSKEGWTCTFEDLDKYEDGKEIKYTIEEEKVEGYTTEIEGSAAKGFVVTNTHTPEKTKVAVSKNWEDNNNQDGKRPTSITINLLANGKKKDSKEVTSKDSWTCTFEDLDKYKDGKEIEYTIREEEVEGYTAEIGGSAEEGFIVTNTHTPEKTQVSVSKNWEDNNNQDGKCPTEITINLLANGKKKDSKEVTSKDSWTCTFEDLDKYEDGKEIKYTIGEEEVEGYTAEIEGSAEEGFVVTNTHTLEKTEITVSKSWKDNDNQDGKRPTRITINLLANGEKKDSKEVTSKTDWTCTFEDLDKYKDGKEIEYTIGEEEVEGYTAEIGGSAEEGFTVTNTHIPEQTEITGSKIWKDNDNQDGKRPTSITVNLLADGEKTDSINVTAETGWKWTFADLPKYAEGKEIHYTVSEEAVENYSTAYSLEGYDITNSYTPGKTAVSGNKIWKDGENQDGIRPESITIHLLADGERIDSRTVTEEDNWKWNFTDLDEYKNGKKIVYTVEEDAVEYYEIEIKDYNVINTHTPETISIPVEKQWNDAGDKESRPESIDVILMRGGDIIQTMTLNQANNWKGTFTDLPRYESGEEIVYTVEEADVEGYITETKVTEEGEILIINTPTKVTIKKVDENNEFVSGAGLAVRDSETGMDVVTLITDDKAIDITGKLTAGKTYYLTETSVPDGYLLAEDVEFTVPEDGSALEVTMVDRKKQEGGKVGQLQVTKQIALLNNDMEFALYAVDATYYVRLFTDPEALHPYGEAKAVHIVNGSGASVSFGNLPEGTYYVRETLADGAPLPMEELIDDTYICIAAEDGSEEVEIAAGTKAETGLVNIYYDIPDGYFISASIDITKEVLKNGETLETDDVFYAGIFTSKTEETPILVEALVNNGTVTVEVPLGGEDGKQPVTYYVFETDASGKKLNKNSFAYTVSGEGGVLLDMENLEGAVTIINEKKEEEITTPAPSITPTPVNAQGSSGSSGTPRSYSQGGKVDPVKTGDHTNANLYLLLLALASVTAGAAVTKKKKAK